MRVAVLSLTRNRLAYTQHCFATLNENAGCDFDHYVLDQGSTDGTADWLLDSYRPFMRNALRENIGVNRGLNVLLLLTATHDRYDCIVKVDNDCELLQPDTLRDVAALAVSGDALLSPTILGLRNPPPKIGTFWIDGELIEARDVIGGIFLAAPAKIFQDGYRHDDSAPPWGNDDAALCRWASGRGYRVGYVPRLTANHYETTDGQHARFPEYFAVKRAEGCPV